MLSLLEVDVARPTGPTIARWQLAAELRELREGAQYTHAAIADVLGCSESKIYKIESGDVGLGRSDLLVMLDRYGVTDERLRETLLALQKQGKERGWWAQFGQLPNPYSQYIGLESAAKVIRTFELAVVPGLLQTEDYARAVITATRPEDGPEETERRVKVRLARQACLTEEPALTLWTIIDESALHRQTGGIEAMRSQLRHLIEMSKRPNVNIQIMPFAETQHPGTLGPFSILEFPEEVHSPVVYVETFAGDAYLEREEDLRRCTMAYTHMHAAALSKTRSVDLIATIASELA